VVCGSLGEGATSVVLEVLDPNLLQTMAMKVMRPDTAQDPEAQRRFIQEAQVSAQLDHPHIVPVHELGVDAQGCLFFTMKLVRGQSLYQRIHERVTLSKQALYDDIDVFLKVCDAVAFAHAKGALHGDIKPSNILVAPFGQVYLMDWGLAALKEPTETIVPVVTGEVTAPSSPGSRRAWGNPAYLAPEQARQDPVDERTDVFQLGGVLYEILTGSPPYSGLTHDDVMARAVQASVVPPEYFPDRELPPPLCQITMKAMAKTPADRYPSVEALQQDVRTFLRSGWHLPQLVWGAGHLVVEEGKEGNAAFIIVHGRCRAFRMVEGKKVVLREMGPGEVFGETAVFTKKPRTASVEAVDDVSLLLVKRKDLEEGLGGSPWLGPFVRAIAERFREVDARCAALERELAQARRESGS
jgi:serine/threonine-protein kinase